MPILGFEYDAQVRPKVTRRRHHPSGSGQEHVADYSTATTHSLLRMPKHGWMSSRSPCTLSVGRCGEESELGSSKCYTWHVCSLFKPSVDRSRQGATHRQSNFSSSPFHRCLRLSLSCLQVYAATRRRILSRANVFYFEGSSFTGLGSPHSPDRYIWPLAHMVDALTTEPTPEGAQVVAHTVGITSGWVCMLVHCCSRALLGFMDPLNMRSACAHSTICKGVCSTKPGLLHSAPPTCVPLVAPCRRLRLQCQHQGLACRATLPICMCRCEASSQPRAGPAADAVRQRAHA